LPVAVVVAVVVVEVGWSPVRASMRNPAPPPRLLPTLLRPGMKGVGRPFKPMIPGPGPGLGPGAAAAAEERLKKWVRRESADDAVFMMSDDVACTSKRYTYR